MPKVSRILSSQKNTPKKITLKKITKEAASKQIKKSKASASEFSVAKKHLVSLPAIDMTDSEE